MKTCFTRTNLSKDKDKEEWLFTAGGILSKDSYYGHQYAAFPHTQTKVKIVLPYKNKPSVQAQHI